MWRSATARSFTPTATVPTRSSWTTTGQLRRQDWVQPGMTASSLTKPCPAWPGTGLLWPQQTEEWDVAQDGLCNAGGHADCEGDVEETRPPGEHHLRMAQAEGSAAGRSDRQGPERNAAIGSSRRLTAADAARGRRSPSTSLAASRSRAGRGRSAGRASRQRSYPHTRSESGW